MLKDKQPYSDLVYQVYELFVIDASLVNADHIEVRGSYETIDSFVNVDVSLDIININPLGSYDMVIGGSLDVYATIEADINGNYLVGQGYTKYYDYPMYLADFLLESDTPDQCLTKFYEAKAEFEFFTSQELDKFQNSTDSLITSARQRYLAWATHLDEDPYIEEEPPVYTQGALHRSVDNFLLLITIISLISIGCYLYFRNKKPA